MVAILHKNRDWLVINKPTGISSQSAFAGDIAVPEWLELYHGEKVYVFSRLDKETSGVMVLARNSSAAARAGDIQRSGKSVKEYVFLSTASALKTQGTEWQVTTPIGGKSAVTRFTRVGPAGKYLLYRAVIRNGRVHQIRRHAKESKVPILGDAQYGGAEFPRLCLHCASVTWPEIGEKITAPLPASMGSLGDFANDPGFLVAFDRRLKFYDGITDAFRCVHRGEMRAVDCSIDFYGGWLCLWIYDEVTPLVELSARLAPYLKKLSYRYSARGAVLKRNRNDPHTRGLVQEQKILGEASPDFFEVTEHGLKYRVSLTQSQHAGLFLDQRDNRLRVRQIAKGRRVANLFSYTGSFSLAAVAGGATSVVSVDTAGPCLQSGKAGLALNGLKEHGEFVKADVRAWLKRHARKVETEGDAAQFDLIICDPPTFSKTKAGGNFSVAKEWEFLAGACRKIGSIGADYLFCTNHREGRKERYREILENTLTRVTTVPAPLDFPVLDLTREHVKMFWCG